jgi:hypothetical protein
MKDAQGVEIPKTQLGKSLTFPRLGGKMWQHWDKDGRRCFSIMSHEDVPLYSFNPTNYFFIQRNGLYKLTLVQYLYVIGTNRFLEPISLPPISIEVKVE